MYKHQEYPKMIYPEGVMVKSLEEENNVRGIVKEEPKAETIPASLNSVSKHKQYRRQ